MNHEQIKQLFLELCLISEREGLPGVATRLGIEPETIAAIYLLGANDGCTAYNLEGNWESAKQSAYFPDCLKADYWSYAIEEVRRLDLVEAS